MPRFIIFVRSTPSSESEAKPNPSLLHAMGIYNDSLRSASNLRLVEGLHPSSRDSARISFHAGRAAELEDGPFPPSELVAGLWIVEVKSLDEAVGWAVKAPFGEGMVTEVRRIAEMGDFERLDA